MVANGSWEHDDNSQPTNPDRHRKDRIRVWGPLLHFLSAFVSLHRTQLTYIYMYILYSSRYRVAFLSQLQTTSQLVYPRRPDMHSAALIVATFLLHSRIQRLSLFFFAFHLILRGKETSFFKNRPLYLYGVGAGAFNLFSLIYIHKCIRQKQDQLIR